MKEQGLIDELERHELIDAPFKLCLVDAPPSFYSSREKAEEMLKHVSKLASPAKTAMIVWHNDCVNDSENHDELDSVWTDFEEFDQYIKSLKASAKRITREYEGLFDFISDDVFGTEARFSWNEIQLNTIGDVLTGEVESELLKAQNDELAKKEFMKSLDKKQLALYNMIHK